MDFKINEYVKSVDNTRKLYSIPVTQGGKITDKEIIENIIYANRKKFENMAELKKMNEFAEILKVRKKDISEVYDERKQGNLYNDLKSNKFNPFELTEKQETTVEKQYKDIKENFNELVYDRPLNRRTLKMIDRLTKDMSKLKLNDNFSDRIKIENYLIQDDRSELPVQQPTNVAPLPPQPQPDAQIVSKPPMPMNQQTGLTTTETGLLTNAEKAMRLRQQGLA